MPLINSSRAVVRHIGNGHAFVDRPEPEPVKSEPKVPEWVRRAKEKQLPGKALS